MGDRLADADIAPGVLLQGLAVIVPGVERKVTERAYHQNHLAQLGLLQNLKVRRGLDPTDVLHRKARHQVNVARQKRRDPCRG